MNTQKVSVIIPLYNESESLPELIKELVDVLDDFDYEILFIDDGSTDESAEIISEILSNNSRIKVIEFIHNYGKSPALAEGFKEATGDYVVTIDADLQDDPREIPNMITKLEEGFDLVSGWKKKRNDPASKRIPSKLFNYTTRLLTGIKIHDFNCGLKVYRKKVVKSLDLYGGMHRYIPVLAEKKGFRVSEIAVNHRPRKYGVTKYGRERYFQGLFDLLTVLFLSRYTKRPLHLFGFIGMGSLFTGFLVNVWVLFLKYVQNEPFSKHMALLVFGVLLLLLGVQFISIGLLGEMIAQSNSRKNEIIKK